MASAWLRMRGVTVATVAFVASVVAILQFFDITPQPEKIPKFTKNLGVSLYKGTARELINFINENNNKIVQLDFKAYL